MLLIVGLYLHVSGSQMSKSSRSCCYLNRTKVKLDCNAIENYLNMKLTLILQKTMLFVFFSQMFELTRVTVYR